MKHIIKQTILLTISNILTRFTAMVFFIVLARYLTVSDYGLFRYLITISITYAILFNGIPIALTKFIGETSNKTKAREYLTNSLIMMIFSFLILVIFILIYNSYKLYLILFVFAALVDSLYIGFVRGLLNYKKLMGYKLTENILQLFILLISYVIYKEINFTFAVIFFSLSGLISLILFELIKPEFKIELIISKEKIKKIIGYTIPVTSGAIGWTIMISVNTIFIKYFYGTKEVGYYSVGITLVQIFSFLPEAVSTILLPKVSGTKKKNQIHNLLTSAVIYSSIISLIFLILLLLFKIEILEIIFTNKYSPALTIILPLAFGQIFISIHQIYAAALQGLNYPGIPSITISIAAILNIIGSFYLTRNYGLIGASVSNALTSFIALAMIILFFYKKLGIQHG